MTNTAHTTDLANYLLALFQLNSDTLGLRFIGYGNHNMIPFAPAVVVVSAPKRRTLAGVAAPGGRTDNDMTLFIDVYVEKVGDETENRMALDQLSEAVEDLIHRDVQFGGLIIHGFVNDWQPTERLLQNGEFRTVRLTFVGRSKTYLSS